MNEKESINLSVGAYDNSFFDYVNSGSLRSARKLLPALKEHIEFNDVLDVGCGQGAWLSIWAELKVNDFIGVDGDYVDEYYMGKLI